MSRISQTSEMMRSWTRARDGIKTHKNVKSLLNIVYCTLFLRGVGCSNVWKNDKLSLVKLAKYHFEGWQFDKVQPIGVDFVHLWWWYFGFSPFKIFFKLSSKSWFSWPWNRSIRHAVRSSGEKLKFFALMSPTPFHPKSLITGLYRRSKCDN